MLRRGCAHALVHARWSRLLGGNHKLQLTRTVRTASNQGREGDASRFCLASVFYRPLATSDRRRRSYGSSKQPARSHPAWDTTSSASGISQRRADSKASHSAPRSTGSPAATRPWSLHWSPLPSSRVSLARRRRRARHPHRGRGQPLSHATSLGAAPSEHETRPKRRKMARLTNGDDMLTFWSRAQYMRRRGRARRHGAAGPHVGSSIPPSFWLTKKQAQRRWASSMTSADQSRLRETTEFPPQFVSPMRRRGEAVMNSPNKPTSILSRSHTPKTPAKAKTNREKKAEMRAEFRQKIKDRLLEVRHAGGLLLLLQ